MCFHDLDPCEGTEGAYQSQQNLLYHRSPPVNHPASYSTADDSAAASFSSSQTFMCLSISSPLADLNLFVFICSLHNAVTTFSLRENHPLPLISVLSHLRLVICQRFVPHLFISVTAEQKHTTSQFIVCRMQDFVAEEVKGYLVM